MSFIAKALGQLMTALNLGRKEKALYLAGIDHPPAPLHELEHVQEAIWEFLYVVKVYETACLNKCVCVCLCGVEQGSPAQYLVKIQFHQWDKRDQAPTEYDPQVCPSAQPLCLWQAQ